MKNTIVFQTSLGLVGISEQRGAISELFIVTDKQDIATGEMTPLLEKARQQLLEYLSGTRKRFDFAFAAEGTEFQKTVWAALREIPYGETRSYKQIAEMIGKPTASRAVGMANNKNPLPIFTPCHRVIGADGKLVGYAYGLDMKKKLLDLEKSLYKV